MTKNACSNEFMCRSQVELLGKKPWNALRAIFNALWSVASCTNSRRQTTLRPIAMSTAAWNGVYFRTNYISLCRTGESSYTSRNWFHRFAERARVGVCPFSLPSLPFTCARALTPTRGSIGSAVQRSSVAPQSGDKKIRWQKNYRRKDRPQIRSFRANNYRINYSARGARALLVHATRAHTREAPRLHGQRGEGTATVRH